MRYYQSMIDCDSLMKGQPYTKLKESYILFICKFDPFHDEKKKGYGLPQNLSILTEFMLDIQWIIFFTHWISKNIHWISAPFSKDKDYNKKLF